MTSSSSLLLHLHLLPPPPPSLLFLHKLQSPSQLNPISFHIHKPRKFSISTSSSSSSNSPSSWEREEIRWLREEQRWEREEKRWVREESRWNSERESLLQEIAVLKNKIQLLEHQRGSVEENVSNIVHVLKEVDLSSVNQNRISESGSGPIPMMLGSEKEEVKEMVVEEVEKVKKREAIRKGSDGEDVRAMQEALSNLGFYSGEEEMEYSIFSSGTERAIKTWQASIGAPEDGNMTAELLEKLFMDQGTVDGTSVSPLEKENTNGASVASVTEVSKAKKSAESEHRNGEYYASHQGVYLLGENRWEDSSRLTGGNKPIVESVVGISTTKCITCRGEGRLLCTECDGTGEPNVEEQFLEWVDEGAKCPYCEGLGYNICDVCEGKTILIGEK